jgi:hypothetical protein
MLGRSPLAVLIDRLQHDAGFTYQASRRGRRLPLRAAPIWQALTRTLLERERRAGRAL